LSTDVLQETHRVQRKSTVHQEERPFGLKKAQWVESKAL
jgi:hypothetical protein